jgi:hypothetical protein
LQSFSKKIKNKKKLKASITVITIKGNKRFWCFKSLDLLKKLDGLPFIETKKTHQQNTMCCQRVLFIPEIVHPQQIKKEFPIDMIIGIPNI